MTTTPEHKHIVFSKETEKRATGHIISKTKETCVCGAQRLVTKTTFRTITTPWVTG